MLELTTRIPVEEATSTPDDSLRLSYALRQRSRQRVVLASGREAGLFLPPRVSIVDGDQLCSVDGTHVVVHAAEERLSNASTDDPLLHARACYPLGNRHTKLQVGRGWVRYEPDHVLDDMLRRLGLTVDSIAAPFEPERGAYHGHAGSESQGHGDAHAHPTGGEERAAAEHGA